MFWPDVIDLKLFYASRLGGITQRILARAIAKIWPDATGECVLGLGYAQPYLAPYRDSANRVLALMPASQGALHWPPGEKNLTFLADEGELPFAEETISRVLIIHAFENTEQLRYMMREVWRVLAPGGRVLVVAPNRRGVWARKPGSPFAQGSPFSASQLRKVLRENRFTAYDSRYTLFTPPTDKEFILKSSAAIEAVGCKFFTVFGGLVLMEGEKQIYAPSTQKVKERKREEVYGTASQPVLG